MEAILVDYYMAKAICQETDEPKDSVREYRQSLYVNAVLKKHGVTQAEFDSSLVYYYTRADRFEPLCKRVADRLEDKALILGASEGEIGKYANANGDTANIWSNRTSLLMMPRPPYNRFDFEIAGDSVFKRGDRLLFQFMTDFMYQSGTRNGVIYMAVQYSDTIVGRSQRFSSSGFTKMDITTRDDRDPKSIRGYLYLHNDDVNSTATKLLFLSNIQLIRFHKVDHEKEKNSVSSASDGESVVDVDGRRDSVWNSNQPLPVGRRTPSDGMAKRPSEPLTR